MNGDARIEEARGDGISISQSIPKKSGDARKANVDSAKIRALIDTLTQRMDHGQRSVSRRIFALI